MSDIPSNTVYFDLIRVTLGTGWLGIGPSAAVRRGVVAICKDRLVVYKDAIRTEYLINTSMLTL